MIGLTSLGGGVFQFSLTNPNGLPFSILASTNLALPLSQWTVIGAPTQMVPGQFQFTDPAALLCPSRFYSARWP